MPRDDGWLDGIAGAVADQKNVDWLATRRSASTPSQRALVRQLQIIDAIGDGGRAVARPRPRGLRLGFYYVIIALAAAEVVVALLVLLQSISTIGAVGASWPFVLNMVLFGTSGLALIAGGKGDIRIRLLGGFFLVIASAFAHPVLPRNSSGILGELAVAFRRMPADAFLALGLWLFAWAFPAEPNLRRMVRVGQAFIIGSGVVGPLLLLVNIVARDERMTWSPFVERVIQTFDRDSPTVGYWTLVFGFATCAIPYLLWKSRVGSVDERHRAAFFTAALAAALMPMLGAVLLSPVMPMLNDPGPRWWLGIVLYATLASVVPITAYAVMVRRIMDVHFVIRKTLQHAVARYAVWCASVLPLMYLAVRLYLDGDRPVSDLMRHGGEGLVAVSIVGFVALTFRHNLLAVVDRWFLREPGDYSEALARLSEFRTSRSIRELGGAVTREIDRAIHPSVVALLVLNEQATELAALDGTVCPLPTDSALVELLSATGKEIQLDIHADGPLTRLLPASDRPWVEESKLQLLCPLNSSTGTLLGVIGVGERRSGFEYSKADRALLSALSVYAATLLENQSLRKQPASGNRPMKLRKGVIDWPDEPATCCRRCSDVCPPKARTCVCGGETTIAAVPLVLNGKFRVERLVGSGGMGVVYLAVDLALNRRVAIKTLPTMSPARAVRLEREARAMASALHPNLALIYGAERWRDAPMLIVEYLESGTLLDRLRRGGLALREVIDLGIVLADALESVHMRGILHRDIKPSNIGYTADGQPKLLDFGLAAMLDPVLEAEDARSAAGLHGVRPAAAALESVTLTVGCTLTQQLVGTPLYLSPEALAGSPPHLSYDLWGLALVLYEAICGRHPLAGKTIPEITDTIQHVPTPDIRDLCSDCPGSVAAFFADALSLERAARPASAGAMRAQLQALRPHLGA